MSTADICVIFNPRSGRDRARQRIQRLKDVLGARAVFRPTERPGHGEELARDAARDGFAIVAAAGGDGTVHEVANGILQAARPDVVLEIYPIGSANDYAHTIGLDPDWRLRCDPSIEARAVDVGVVSAPDGRRRHFVNGLGLGINGIVNLEARRIRRLQGLALYGMALLRTMCFRYGYPLMTVTLDGQERRINTLALTLAIGRREGNFVLAPDAVIDDGLFDYLHAGPLPRLELFWNLPGMISGRLPKDHPKLWRGRCRHVTVVSETPLPFHIDGELFSEPDKAVYALDVQILPGALRVMAKQAAATALTNAGPVSSSLSDSRIAAR
jgi:diacylglycerol kinase family enzyme